ncbi:TolC family protein [Pedobacter riviphilus]|uniref:TolC family protein n=1 Tax=Pedobacter riviphilus TaxID=2766984 RepID=A0ABX6TQ17_9SPHI|nr:MULTISPECIES: TolC family protein [Pedobacter]NII83212.1 cobalt-zinc-cadmium efflux system outer membrane protein [Pedobacter sp. SG908]QNR86799.1 TolC family protein [Pedobacter riviphilus]
MRILRFQKIYLSQFLAVCLICLSSFRLHAQNRDTISLSLPQIEAKFLSNNLKLIAQHYNIDRANAEMLTSKLFPNPVFAFGQGLYTKSRDTNVFSQQTYGISQLILTAGKRNKALQLAKVNSENARYEFFDLVRTLKFSLRSNFYNLYYLQQSINLYQQEITSLQKTLQAFQLLNQKGNISQKEVLRIQSLVYSIQSEQAGLITQTHALQAELSQLIGADGKLVVKPDLGGGIGNGIDISKMPFQTLLDSALLNRQDLKIAKSNINYNMANLKLQKAMAYPDITLSLNYDKKAGYGLQYVSGGISIPLPIFNRNQGNIRLAKVMLDQSKVLLQDQQNTVQNELTAGYEDAVKLEKVYQTFDPKFRNNYQQLINEVYKNYEKRNISLVEFLDLYTSFKANVIQMNNLQLQRITALEKINFLTASQFFNP